MTRIALMGGTISFLPLHKGGLDVFTGRHDSYFCVRGSERPVRRGSVIPTKCRSGSTSLWMM